MHRASTHSLRCLLIGILLVGISPGGTPAWAIWPFERTHERPDLTNPRDAAAHVLQRAIQFDTTNPPGDEKPPHDTIAGRPSALSRSFSLAISSSKNARISARTSSNR